MADLHVTDPDAVVVSVGFPLPDTIDAVLADGTHLTYTIEPVASGD